MSGAVASKIFLVRLICVLIPMAPLLIAGSVIAILATSGGSGHPAPDALAAARSAPAGYGLPVQAGSGPSASAAGLPPFPPASAATQPPPVVDGVPRTNVGSAHSPRMEQQLSGSSAAAPRPPEAGALGVDVAVYQHPHGAAIDWAQVAAAGYKFAFIKATEGDYYANPYYPSDLAQAEAAGLYAAGYHFAIPNVSDGASQADYAVQSDGYTAAGRALPLALDIEYNPYGAECYGLSAGQMVSWLSAFTAEAQRLTGRGPIIYTTADWWRTCTGDSAAFAADPLWVAAYGSSSPPMPSGWASWTFWQFTSRASVPGISGNVDVSYFLHTAALALLSPPSSSSPASSSRSAAAASSAAASSAPAAAASSPSGSPSDSPSASPSGSPSDSPSASPSDSPSPSSSPSPSGSPSPSDSPSASPTVCPSPTDTPSPSPSPSPSPTPTDTSCPSPSPSLSPTAAPSSSAAPSSATASSSATAGDPSTGSSAPTAAPSATP